MLNLRSRCGSWGCLALTAESETGDLEVSYQGKAGCTQYKIWGVAPDTGVISVNYVENNGGEYFSTMPSA